MKEIPHVSWLRAFEAAARHNSFSAAAEELNLTPAAVSQQIRLLEQHLNVRLFERLARGVALTDLGHSYAVPVRRSFLEIEKATHALLDGRRTLTVRVRASISFAALVLAPRLPGFRAAYPHIAVELSTAVWADRFGDDTLDIDIRYGHGDWPEAAIHALGEDVARIVCHPDFAERLGPGACVASYAAERMVQIVGSEQDWPRLSEIHSLGLPNINPWVTADSSLIALQTVASGEGVTIVLDSYARPYLDNGTLIAPFPHTLPIPREHYMIVRESAERRAEVTAFCEWVLATCAVQSQ